MELPKTCKTGGLPFNTFIDLYNKQISLTSHQNATLAISVNEKNACWKTPINVTDNKYITIIRSRKDVGGTDSRPAVCGLSNCDCAVQSCLSRALMTSHWEEVRVCHVGLCATHLHCCSWSPGLTFKPVICLQPDRKRPSSITGAVVAPRHSSAVG